MYIKYNLYFVSRWSRISGRLKKILIVLKVEITPHNKSNFLKSGESNNVQLFLETQKHTEDRVSTVKRNRNVHRSINQYYQKKCDVWQFLFLESKMTREERRLFSQERLPSPSRRYRAVTDGQSRVYNRIKKKVTK